MKSKQGIFDSTSRKIVGTLNLDDGVVVVEETEHQ